MDGIGWDFVTCLRARWCPLFPGMLRFKLQMWIYVLSLCWSEKLQDWRNHRRHPGESWQLPSRYKAGEWQGCKGPTLPFNNIPKLSSGGAFLQRGHRTHWLWILRQCLWSGRWSQGPKARKVESWKGPAASCNTYRVLGYSDGTCPQYRQWYAASICINHIFNHWKPRSGEVEIPGATFRQVVAIKKCKRIFEDLVDCKRILREVENWKFLVHWLFHYVKILYAYIYIYHIYLQYAFFSGNLWGPQRNFFQGSNNSEIFSWKCHWRKNPAFVCKCSLDRSAFYPSWAMGVLEIFGNI